MLTPNPIPKTIAVANLLRLSSHLPLSRMMPCIRRCASAVWNSRYLAMAGLVKDDWMSLRCIWKRLPQRRKVSVPDQPITSNRANRGRSE